MSFMKKCVGHCIADYIDTNRFVVEYNGEVTKHKECILLKHDESEVYIFPYGVVVIWGELEKSDVLQILAPYLMDQLPSKRVILDEFEVSRETSGNLVKEDVLYLPEEDEYIRLALSHPIAQSLKLSHLEEDIILKTASMGQIPHELAETGKIRYSKRSISKMRGELHLLKSAMHLNYALLDKPDFFWAWPEYDSYYQKLFDYLEMAPRIALLNKRMETIDELLSILVEELNHRHSSRLEWIIIWLIAIEIIMSLGPHVLKFFQNLW
jgi:uncharacterized Rmd1/YagE family protein